VQNIGLLLYSNSLVGAGHSHTHTLQCGLPSARSVHWTTNLRMLH